MATTITINSINGGNPIYKKSPGTNLSVSISGTFSGFYSTGGKPVRVIITVEGVSYSNTNPNNGKWSVNIKTSSVGKIEIHAAAIQESNVKPEPPKTYPVITANALSSFEVIADQEAPQLKVEFPSEAFESNQFNVQPNIQTALDNVSGLVGLQYKINNEQWIDIWSGDPTGDDKKQILNFLLPAAIGSYTVTVRAIDSVGNIAEQTGQIVAKDNLAPNLQIIEPGQNVTVVQNTLRDGKFLKVSGVVNDTQSGMNGGKASLKWALNDSNNYKSTTLTLNNDKKQGSWSFDVEVNHLGSQIIYLKATDKDGNTKEEQIRFKVISEFKSKDLEERLSRRAYLEDLLQFARDSVIAATSPKINNLDTPEIENLYFQSFEKLSQPLFKEGEKLVSQVRIAIEVLKKYLQTQPMPSLMAASAAWKLQEKKIDARNTVWSLHDTTGLNKDVDTPNPTTPMGGNTGTSAGITGIDGYKGGYAMSFDGKNRLLIPNSPHLEIGKNDGDFTVSFFLLVREKPNNFHVIMRKGALNKNEQRTPGILLVPNTSKLEVRVATATHWNEGIQGSNKELDLNKWYHIVVVKQGRELNLYIDGVLDSMAILSDRTVSHDSPWILGKDDIHAGGINGAIDQLAIFNYAVTLPGIKMLGEGWKLNFEFPKYCRKLYEALLTNLGTSYEELRLHRGNFTADYEERQKLAQRLGVSLTLSTPDEIDQLLFEPSELTEDNLEKYFGIRSTGKDSLAPIASPLFLEWRKQSQREHWIKEDNAAEFVIIDPDLIDENDLEFPSNQSVFTILESRRKVLLKKYTELKKLVDKNSSAPLLAFSVILDNVSKGAGLEILEKIERAGGIIEPVLEESFLNRKKYSFLLRIKKLAETSIVTPEEWESVFQILVSVFKRQQFNAWLTEERQAGIILSPGLFRISEEEKIINSWRGTYIERFQWQDKLALRIEQKKNLEDSFYGAIGEAEAIGLPLLRDELLGAMAKKARVNDIGNWLTERFLIDMKGNSRVVTTRVQQAIETLQNLIFSVRIGRIPQGHPASEWQISISHDANTMAVNQILNPNQFIDSPNRNFRFVYQPDGNLVLYRIYKNGYVKAIWNSNTMNIGNAGKCEMRSDGFLVVYQKDGKSLWEKPTSGIKGSTLAVQDNGNIVIFDPNNNPVWYAFSAQELFDQEWKWMGSYESWRAAMSVFLFPENYLLPALNLFPSEDFDDLLVKVRGRTLSLEGVKNLSMTGFSEDEKNFFVPILIGETLQQSGHFVQALDWFRKVYDYDNHVKNPKLSGEKNEEPDLTRGQSWTREDLHPHLIAARRKVNSYTRYTLMSIVRCLLEFGDAEFTRDTFESVARARSLYFTARELLNLSDLNMPPSSHPEEPLIPNPVLEMLRTKEALQLFKIRQGRNIAGMVRDIEVPQITGLDESISFDGSGEVQTNANSSFRPTPYHFKTLIERSKQWVGIAQQIEAAYLSAMEKKQGKAYEFFEASKGLNLAKANVQLHIKRVDESKKNESVSKRQKEKFNIQKNILDDRINSGFNSYENAVMQGYEDLKNWKNWMSRADTIVALAQLSVAAAGGASGSFGTTVVAAAPGLAVLIGKAILAENINETESKLQSDSFMASHERQKDDWKFQASMSEQDFLIAEEQIQLSIAHTGVVEEERKVADLQAKQANDTVQYLAKQEFNEVMYQWMSGVLGGIYAYFLQQATAIAKTAQYQLAFERQSIVPFYIQSDYWVLPDKILSSSQENGDAPKDRKGLTGAELLLRDIYQLDQFAFETDKRKLNISQTFSLAQMFPVEFQEFRQTGALRFNTPMSLFDRDFPGHYLRLIKRGRVSVVALIPPSKGIRASLSYSGVSRVVVEGQSFQQTVIRRDPEYVALTSPTGASGVFELDVQSELLQPFEGSGVDATWEFLLPKAANPFDFNSIADVLLTLEFTALNSYDYRQQVIKTLRRDAEAERMISIRDSFPDSWYDLHNSDLVEDSNKLVVSFKTTRADFPSNMEILGTQQIVLYFLFKKDTSFAVPVNISFNGRIGGLLHSTEDGILSTRSRAVSWLNMLELGSFNKLPFGTWNMSLNEGTPNEQNRIKSALENGDLEDILFVITYSGRLPEWV